jgi:hypothetical protein
MKNAQMQDDDALCIVCREGITNPICPECMAEQVRGWHPDIGPYLAVPAATGTVRCLFCGKRMSICAHCYASDIEDLVGGKRPKLAEEFREIFGLRKEAQV